MMFALIVAVSARLKIMSPESLSSQFKNNEVPAKYADFGKVPYGRTIMGKIHFDPFNELGCNEFSLNDYQELERSADITPFYLAKGGDCSYV